jgi:hypothetical protein
MAPPGQCRGMSEGLHFLYMASSEGGLVVGNEDGWGVLAG